MELFKRNNKTGEEQQPSAYKRDTHKAKRFFEHAHTVADARNYDYAVACFINGLRHDPDNMTEHEALRDVSLKRKLGGGKPAGFMESLKGGGKDPLEKMLHSEMLWAKDPLNLSHMITTMERAVEANQQIGEDVNLGPVVVWIGQLVLTNQIGPNKRPKKSEYLKLCGLLEQVEAFDKAVDACKLALQQDPENATLMQRLKDLEAERTMKDGGYNKAGGKEGGFREMVKDLDKQKALEQQDAISKTESTIDQIIKRARAQYEEDPQDADRARKLVEALLNKESDESENDAITVLRDLWERTGQYLFKARMGDVTMRQSNRHLREAVAAVKAHPDDQALRQKYHDIRQAKLEFELGEYQERVQNYPTDMRLRYELGRRLLEAKRIDEAIAAFQEAQADPKHRSSALELLGSCYVEKGWLDEAVTTFRKGIAAHPLKDDARALELRYKLMDTLERQARKNKSADQAKEALAVGSEILQTDIKFKDIRARMDKLRTLAGEL